MEPIRPAPVRTLLVSDVHLGCKHSQTQEFLHFLRRFDPAAIYLVGDFIDSWKINAGWHWSRECDLVIEHLMGLANDGTKIHYVPGNHDAFLRSPTFQAMLPTGFSRCEIANEFVFETLHGWRFLVTHGDLFDFFETRMQWTSKASTIFYDSCLSLNRWIARRVLDSDRNPYGACGILKNRIKRGVRFISGFEAKLIQHARNLACQGVVCGHIHTPALVAKSSMFYCNTGDWVENCTGIVEHLDGRLQLISRYADNVHVQLPRRSVRHAAGGCSLSGDQARNQLVEHVEDAERELSTATL